MDANHDNPLSFGEASPAELPAALELLFNRLPQPLRAAQIQTAQEEIAQKGGEGQIVLVGWRGTKLVAAIWVEIRAGHVASLWAPELAADEPTTTGTAIIRLAVDKATAAGALVVQSLLETDAGREPNWLQQCGFQHITDLLYLVSLREDFPTTQPESNLVFEPLGKAGEIGISETQMRRLSEIIRRTYIETKDCPAVHGQRTIDDVLVTYRAVGTFHPAWWFFVRHHTGDIGCLILAEHPAEQNGELVYMGIVPEARGNAWGLEIVRYAQWIAGESERDKRNAGKNNQCYAKPSVQQMILAVDAANSPAIAMYAAAGFQAWDRRSVFLRQIAEKL